MKPRTVRLLKPKSDAWKRRASQRRYRKTAKGRAAQARASAKWYAKPENRARALARSAAWYQANKERKRSYQRVWIHFKRREAHT